VSNSIAPNDTGGAVVTGVHVWPSAVPTEPTATRQAKRTANAGKRFMVSVILDLVFSTNLGREESQFLPQELKPVSAWHRKEKLCRALWEAMLSLFDSNVKTKKIFTRF
jgi:hypothetical protein